MSAFVPPTGSAPAAGSSNTPAGNDVSSADMGQMGSEGDTSGDGMSMGQLQPTYSPPGQQAPAEQHNYTPTGTPGQYAHHAPGHTAPAGRPNISTKHGVSLKGLGAAISHLRGSSTEKGPHSSAGEKSAGLKSNGAVKGPAKK